jgi:hypothetical protein
LILSEHTHFSPDSSGVCAHCGQALPARGAGPRYGERRFNYVGLGITVLLHLLLALGYLWAPSDDKRAPPPAAGEAITYVLPKAVQPTPKPVPATRRAPVKPRQQQERINIQQLPDTITVPREEVREPAPQPPVPVAVDPNADMSDMIAARRRARGQASEQPQGESEQEKGMRNALANIAAANGRSKGDDSNDTGGVFSIADKSFSRAKVKFRGWNPSFKRRWLQQVDVELGNQRDIETAIVKKMVEIIRKEKTGDFDWDSHRLQRVVTLSAREQDTAELEAFLFKEMFPGYQPPR